MTELGKEQEGQSHRLPHVSTDYDAESESESSSKIISSNSNKNPTKKRFQKLLFTMYLAFKEVALMVFLTLTYAALTSDPSKVSKSPVAFPFFDETSIVEDWYNGELGAAIEKSRKSNVAFVMFYAPWDSESQSVRSEFNLAARYMQKHVKFTAVNCWQPGSECRRQYGKAYNWPILIAYSPHGNGIQYKGPRTAHYMMKFLTTFSRPLIRISSEDQVHSLLGDYDAVVLGCVNALPGSLEYAVLYTTALKFLERDPFQEIAFAVLTGSDNKCYDNSRPSLLLYMWNETLIYPSNDDWRSDALLSWISKSIHQVSMWVIPMGTKSLSLSTYIQPGPALVIFTPRTVLAQSVDYYDLLREVGLEYYNCEEHQRIQLNSFLIHTRRLENYLKHTYHLKSCLSKSNFEKKDFPSVVTVSKNWINNSCCPNSMKCNMVDNIREKLSKQCKNMRTCDDGFRVKSKEFVGKIYDEDDDLGKKLVTSMISDQYDPRSPKNLQKLWKKEKCRIAYLSNKMHPTLFSSSIVQQTNGDHKKFNIHGLSCKSNSSLALIALDSLKYYHFAERLGINIALKKDLTAAVIINEKMESHYVLQESLNDYTLREFIYNFTNNNLARSFNSLASVKHPETHVYPYQKDCFKKYSSELCSFELNTQTFLPTIMQEGKAVMVLYYSKQCSFCNGISHSYLTVTKLFSSIPSIRFTRIDGDLNVLPWEYTMDSYPTIILFPQRKKSESRVFPRTMPVTVKNLVNFVLANLDSNLKLHALWTICNQTKYDDDRGSCIASVRAENLSIIGHTLRAWRNADVLTKTKLLYKLQQLRNINLLLAHSSHNTNEIHKRLLNLHQSTFKDLQSQSKKRTNYLAKDEL